jgi:hypothetical protein
MYFDVPGTISNLTVAAVSPDPAVGAKVRSYVPTSGCTRCNPENVASPVLDVTAVSDPVRGYSTVLEYTASVDVGLASEVLLAPRMYG